MTYSPEEELEIKKVLQAFASYIEESDQLEIIRTPKAGYVILALEGDPAMAEDGFTVETGADLCDFLMREIGYEFMTVSPGTYQTLRDLNLAEQVIVLHKIRKYTAALPEYRYLEDHLFTRPHPRWGY